MDCLKGIAEHEEGEWGECIIARDEALRNLEQEPGLGPPDLVWLQKAPAGTLTSGRGVARSYCHYVLGREVTSCASVAAYFAQVSNLVEPATFFQGLVSGQRKVDRGFYCCYEPLSRLDVRCELCVPGGVTAAAVDAQGNLHEVTDWMWARCQLAAFLRAELLDAELIAHAADNLQRYEPVQSVAAEAALLTIVEEMYREGVLPGGLDALAYDQAGGCSAEQMDIVLFAVLHHFGRRQRWATAAAFFKGLAQHHCAAAVYVAAALRELGQSDQAMELLKQAAEREPFQAQVLVALATEYMFDGQLEAALKLSRRAIRAAPGLRPSWLLLARCYARMGELPLALLALNCTPPPSLPVDEEGLLFVVPPPKPKARTKPKCAPYDYDVTCAVQLLSEDAGALPEEAAAGDGERPLLYLPGAVLVNREPPDRAAWADVAPYRATRATLATVYGILQEIVATAGWDDFLDIRSEVFIMYSEGVGGEGDHQDSGSDEAHPAEHGGDHAAGNPVTAASSTPPSGTAPSATAPSGTAPGGTPPPSLDVARMWGRVGSLSEDRPPSPRAALASPGGGGLQPQLRGVGSFLADAIGTSAELLAESGAGQGLDGAPLGEPPPNTPQPPAASNVGGAPFSPNQLSSALGAQLDLRSPTAGDATSGGGGGTPSRAFQAVRLPGMARRLAPASQGDVPHFLSAPLLAAPQQQQQQVGSGGSGATAVPKDDDGLVTVTAVDVSATAGGAQPAPPLPSSTLLARAGSEGRAVAAASTVSSDTPPPSSAAPAVPGGTEAPLVPAVPSGTGAVQGPAKATSLWGQVFGSTSRPGPVAEGVLAAAITAGGTTAVGSAAAARSATATGNATARGSATSPHGPCADESSRHAYHTGGGEGAHSSHQQQAASLVTDTFVPSSPTAHVGPSKMSSKARRLQPGPVAEATSGPIAEATATTAAAAAAGAAAGGGGGAPSSDRRSTGNLRLHGLEAHLRDDEYLLHNHSPAEARDEPRAKGQGRSARRMDALRKAEEADREAAVVGRMPTAPAAGADGGQPPKRVCGRWLDELIVSFWHDLQAYLEWQALDRELISVAGLGHAGIVLDLPLPPAAGSDASPSDAVGGDGSTSDAAAGGGGGRASSRPDEFLSDGDREALLARVPQLSCADWVRRGLLAERLYHDDQALLAYRAALHLGFSMVAYNALMRLTAANGLAKQALQAVQQVMTWHDQQHAKVLGGHAAAAAPARPRASPAAGDVDRTASSGGGSSGGRNGSPKHALALNKSGGGSSSGQAPPTDALVPPVEGAYTCPLPVLCCISMLVSVVGLDALVDAQVELGFAMHPAVRNLLDTFSVWT